MRERAPVWREDFARAAGDGVNRSLYFRPFNSGATGQPVDMNMVGVHDGVVGWPLQNVRRRPGQTAGRRIARQKDAAQRQRNDFVLLGSQSALSIKEDKKGLDRPDPQAQRRKGDAVAVREMSDSIDRVSKLGIGNEHSFRQRAPGGEIAKIYLAGLISQ